MARYEVVIDTACLACQGADVVLSGREGRHLARVRRIRQGASARLKDGLGRAFSARVVSVKRDTVRFALERCVPCPDDTLPVILMPAVIKGKRMDWLVQKACELGVREIQPVITERTLIKKAADRQKRCRRWEEIACQALKQCGGNMLTRINIPVPVTEIFEGVSGMVKIMLWEGRDGSPLFSLLKDAASMGQAAILAGPEGGFTRGEVAQCMERGFITATLGSRILRTETAALAALVQISAILQDIQCCVKSGEAGV